MNYLFRKYCRKKANDPNYYQYVDISHITTPVTVLLGPNGCGKSMSMVLMKEYCESKHFPCSSYSNSSNDVVSHAFLYGFENLIWSKYSEGERINASLNNWDDYDFLRELLTHEKDLYFFIDELDSGLSIDKLTSNIKEYLEILTFEKEKHPNRTVNLIFTCNSYEMLELLKDDPRTKLIWVPTLEEIKINSYEEFRKLYLDYLRVYNLEKEKRNERRIH